MSALTEALPALAPSREQALCSTAGVNMGPDSDRYSNDPAWAEARAVCGDCRVIEACFRYALDHPQDTKDHVWAGFDPGQWAFIRKERRLPNARKPRVLTEEQVEANRVRRAARRAAQRETAAAVA